MCRRPPATDTLGMQIVVRVQGPLGPAAAAAFDDLEVRTETVVAGELTDDAALHGVLNRFVNLGLKVVDVKVDR